MATSLATIIFRRLSAERLEPYLQTAHGQLDRALALYEWNLDASAAFWRTLSQVEVVLRNAFHDQLTAWSDSVSAEPRWYVSLAGTLTYRARDDIVRARQRATATGKDETPGRVVAELGFGFWRYLLAARYERTLWLPALRAALPHHRGMRRDAEKVVKRLHHLRNRIAHHEPIHYLDLVDLRLKAFTVVAWICPSTRTWIEDRCSIGTVLDSRPTLGAELS